MAGSDLETQVRVWAEAQLDDDRLAHVRGVVATVTDLAARYTPEHVARLRLAAWIHDVAKGWDDAALLDYAERHELPVTPGDRAMPLLLHGAVAYRLAAAHFGLDDPLIESACRLHTTGAPEMTVTDKILYVADLIEPTREFKSVARLRCAARRDLDEATLRGVDVVLKRLIRKQRSIDPRALALHNHLVAAGVRYGKPRAP